MDPSYTAQLIIWAERVIWPQRDLWNKVMPTSLDLRRLQKLHMSIGDLHDCMHEQRFGNSPEAHPGAPKVSSLVYPTLIAASSSSLFTP